MRRSQGNSNKKKLSKLSVSQVHQSLQSNTNACDQNQIHGTSRLELIGNLLIDKLKGSERSRLKQQLLMSYSFNSTTSNNLSFSSSKRSFKQLLTDIQAFDRHTLRQYRTIAVGDHEINTNVLPSTLDTVDVTSKNTNTSQDESHLPTTPKRKTRQRSLINSTPTTDVETAKTPNTVTRTIYTRSSKLNALNNNQNQSNHIHSNRARKRRSSVLHNNIPQTEINTTVDHTLERTQKTFQKMKEDVSGVKVSRRKLQSSVPLSTTVEHSKTSHDF